MTDDEKIQRVEIKLDGDHIKPPQHLYYGPDGKGKWNRKSALIMNLLVSMILIQRKTLHIRITDLDYVKSVQEG